MKIKFLLFFLMISALANSQVNNSGGMRGEATFNIFSNSNDHLPTYRAVAFYDIYKFQLYGGLVFSKKSELNDRWAYWPFGGGRTKAKTGLTGGVIGARYHKGNKKNRRIYGFFESTILYFSTCESLQRPYYSTSKVEFELVDDAGGKNKTFIIQPMAGAGVEFKLYKFINLSLDFGWGFTYRSLTYDNPLSNSIFGSNYGDELFGIGGQIRVSLGFSI